MKVAIFNTFLEGTSTGKIASGLYQQLKRDGHQCKVLYGGGERKDNPDFIKIANDQDIRLSWLHNQISGVHGAFAPFVNRRVRRVLENFQPDIIQLYNLHYYYLDMYWLFSYLKKNGYNTVYSMLDEYPYLGYCCYAFECNQFKTGCRNCNYKQFRKTYPRNLWRNGAERTIQLKKLAYQDFKSLIFVAPEWVIGRAKESYLLRDKKMEIVDEFVDNENIFIPRDSSKLKKKLRIPDDHIILLNVAPSKDPRKGVQYYIRLAERMLPQKYTFVHVGYQGDTFGLPSNFIPIPFVGDQIELATYYSMADLFICTSVADTMPNVCLDALSCGTPVAGFNVTGVPYVAEDPLGKFVEKGDIDALEAIVRQTVKKTEEVSRACRNYALSRYSPRTYYKKMMEIYKKIKNGDI